MDDRPAPTEAESRELDRVGAFSDGVFAIAITLLVLNLEIPTVNDQQTLWDGLSDLDGDLQAYFISFAVIGGFWYGHHKVFSLLDRSNGQLILLNFILLSLIALMPFTTDLLGTYGDEFDAVAFYAINLGLAAFADGMIEVLAARKGLAPRGALGGERELLWGAVFRAAVFFLSIPVAYFVAIWVAEVSWILLLLAPRAGQVLGRKQRSAA